MNEEQKKEKTLECGKPATDSPSPAVGDVNAGLRQAAEYARDVLARLVLSRAWNGSVPSLVRHDTRNIIVALNAALAASESVTPTKANHSGTLNSCPAALEGRDPAIVMAVFNAAMAMHAEATAPNPTRCYDKLKAVAAACNDAINAARHA